MAKSYPTLLGLHGRPRGSFVRGLSQARILEWVAISFFRESSQPRDRTCDFFIGMQVLYRWAIREAPTLHFVVQLSSWVRLFATPCTAAHQASLSLIISQSLPKFMSIASVMPSNHLILWQPLLLLSSIFPSIRDFSNESAVCIRWPTMEFQLQHQSFQQEFRVDFPYDWLVWSHCYPKDCQESSPAPQFKGINSLALFIFYGPALTTVQLNSARG